MSTVRKWWKWALAIAALLATAQIGASMLVRTRRVRAYLTVRLARAFGRPIEVRRFAVSLLPVPRLDAEQVTVGEDPDFGNEYFLRADGLSASLRWTGLLRGHFELGTLSLSRPSLILVRNSAGAWNLQSWLPSSRGTRKVTGLYGPPSPAPSVNRLQKIEFDEGRVNFKIVDEKLPFAFIGVSGSVDQVAPGRWQLSLEAQPWRSGVVLQSVGTLHLQGGVAGTSARLQPAEISVHWEEVSLADLFRLLHGNDYGVRGLLTLDGTMKSDGSASNAGVQAEDWRFTVEARTSQIHRWDLGERSDNPRLRIGVTGLWNAPTGKARVERVTVEGPRSNLRGTATYQTGPAGGFELHVDSAGIQAMDILAWLRAFQPGIDDGVSADQFFTGALALRGWPPEVEHAAVSSNGGVLRIPGLKLPIHIGAVRGGRERNALVFEPVRVMLGGTARDGPSSKKRRPGAAGENSADLTFEQDLSTSQGTISVEGQIQKSEEFLKTAAAFGHPLNHGWELSGEAAVAARWEWSRPFEGTWSGRVVFTKAKLAVAGLNQPLDIQGSTLTWDQGRRSVDATKVNGFGGTWSGSIMEASGALDDKAPRWIFHFAVDRMNTAELDRWVGPRARPNWLQRLLASFLGGSAPSSGGSALVRRVNAEGDVDVGELSIEQLLFTQVHAAASLRNFELEVPEADAQWAGGLVHAQVHAAFAPRPQYEIRARLEHVNLTGIPGASRALERVTGFASGTVELETHGVGRDELLQTLAGSGDVQLKSVAIRGWDVDASLADGQPHAGTSRWTSGSGTFTMRNRAVTVTNLKLESGPVETLLQGSVSFARDADLTMEAALGGKKAGRTRGTIQAGRVLKIFGPLDGPRVTIEKAATRQPAD